MRKQTWNGDWHGELRVYKFSPLHNLVFTPLPMLAIKTVLLRSFSTLSPQFLHPFVQQSHQFGPCWPWLTPLGHCRTCVNLCWICDKQLQQLHHELRLACVWGWNWGVRTWNASVFTVFKITDAQVLRNPTWGHPVFPPGPRKGLNHSWEMNYQEKIFWEQKKNCLNTTS